MGEIRMTVRVKPGSSRTKVGGAYGDDRQLVVAVNSPPVDGAANDSVIKAVAAAFGLRRHQVSIASGHTARSKVLVLDIADSDADALRTRWEQLLLL